MTTHHMIVNSDNLTPLIDWLKTNPPGMCRVLIAGTDTPVQALMSALTKHRAVAQWCVAKITAGELTVGITGDDIPDDMLNVVVTTDD